VLEKYGLSREIAARYVDAITRSNQTQTAEELDVSRDTINRYKNAFAEMNAQERLLLISTQPRKNSSTKPQSDPSIAQAYQKGDRVKLILDKELGPDKHLHGKTGEIIDVSFDDAASVTGDSEDNFIYTVKLDSNSTTAKYLTYISDDTISRE
jgi:ribosomal protein L21E